MKTVRLDWPDHITNACLARRRSKAGFFIIEAAIGPNAQGLGTSAGAVARLSGYQPRMQSKRSLGFCLFGPEHADRIS